MEKELIKDLVSEATVDYAVQQVIDGVCSVAHACLDEEDAVFFLDQLNEWFAHKNELLERNPSDA
tara:strand:+ start:3773 stop:3967 length:195 start_codon:yes stop_codon:yes gene_type:complete